MKQIGKISYKLLILIMILNFLFVFQTFLMKWTSVKTGVIITEISQLTSTTFYIESLSILSHYPLLGLLLFTMGITFIFNIFLAIKVDVVRLALLININNVIEVIVGILVFDDPFTWKLPASIILISAGTWILTQQIFEKKVIK